MSTSIETDNKMKLILPQGSIINRFLHYELVIRLMMEAWSSLNLWWPPLTHGLDGSIVWPTLTPGHTLKEGTIRNITVRDRPSFPLLEAVWSMVPWSVRFHHILGHVLMYRPMKDSHDGRLTVSKDRMRLTIGPRDCLHHNRHESKPWIREVWTGG